MVANGASSDHRWLLWSATSFRVVLTVVTALVLVQAVLAGQLLSGNAVSRVVHSIIGDDVLPWVVTVQLVLAVLVWRPSRGPWWPAVASLGLLVAVIAQLALGFEGRVDLHVPLGVAIFGTTVGLLAGTRRLAATRRESHDADDRRGRPSAAIRPHRRP